VEIVLTNDDLEELIKKTFSGVQNVTFNYKVVKAILEVDRAQFSTIPTRTGMVVSSDTNSQVFTSTSAKEKREITPEQERLSQQAEQMNELQNLRQERNKMVGPGEDRPLPVVG
jgi:transcription antitermination factor NusA-like protein